MYILWGRCIILNNAFEGIKNGATTMQGGVVGEISQNECKISEVKRIITPNICWSNWEYESILEEC